MARDRNSEAPRSGAGFTAWLDGLRFSVHQGDYEAVRAAYDQLVQMNELNRAPVAVGVRTPDPGTDR